MDGCLKLIFFISFLRFNDGADNTQILLNQLFKVITNALGENSANESNYTRQYPGSHTRPGYGYGNDGISSTVYTALQTITRNDELECVPRLLCETAAGGQPGGTRQISIDKQSLTTLLSYLQLDSGNTSPLLTFGKAALLGLSHRGDPYSCIVNYPRCPRDQTRLLYYLNNHRGGLFRYFDMKVPHHNPNQYRPGYYQNNKGSYYQYQRDYQNDLHYNIHVNKIKPNQNYLVYPNKNRLYKESKKPTRPEIYAKKYDHSSMSFSAEDYQRFSKGNRKAISFPTDRKDTIQPRIQTKIIREQLENDYFTFSNSKRGSKSFKDHNFFPHNNNVLSGYRPAALPTDRLPNMFYFPEFDYRKGKQMKFPVSYVKNSFFPDQ